MSKIYCMLKYGESEIRYEIIHTERKKTVEVAVLPDCSVVIKAPKNADDNRIKAIVKKRAKWIQHQIEYFKQFSPRTPMRQYLSGESHRYLGKTYRLKVQVGSEGKVRLLGGYFYVDCKGEVSSERAKSLMQNWYMEKAKLKFAERLGVCGKSFGLAQEQLPNLRIRSMKTRWGSLSSKGNMTLNLELIKAPVECIDYVVVHELCHLKHKNHGAEFYKLLEKAMPDWKKRKHKLELSLI